MVIYGYKLGTIPAGVYVDEAVVGYDAWSIIKTGRDHFGQLLPIYFKFFGSFTPGLFVYVESIFVYFLGLNAVALRLPSLISMLVLVIALYKFFKNENLTESKDNLWILMLFFVVTPWVLFNARLGYETTFAFVLWSVGILNYKNSRLSFVLISLSTYASHGQRYLAPITILIIYFIYYFRNKRNDKLFLGLLMAFVVQIPNILLMLTPSFWVKSSSITSSFVSQYLSYFSPINLFYKSDYDLQRSMPQMAIFFSWMIIPWTVGLYKFLTNSHRPVSRLIIALCLVSPIPAALANTNYSTQRALPLLLPYSIFILVGINYILSKFNKFIRLGIFVMFFIFSIILLGRSYFILFPKQRCEAWNCGYDQVANLVLSNPDKSILIDNSRIHADILMLFWLKYSPSSFQRQNIFLGNYYYDLLDSKDIAIDNVEVRPINWKKDTCKMQIIVGDDLSISPGQVKEHYLKNVLILFNNQQKIILQAYETDPVAKCGLDKIIK